MRTTRVGHLPSGEGDLGGSGLGQLVAELGRLAIARSRSTEEGFQGPLTVLAVDDYGDNQRTHNKDALRVEKSSKNSGSAFASFAGIQIEPFTATGTATSHSFSKTRDGSFNGGLNAILFRASCIIPLTGVLLRLLLLLVLPSV